MEAVDDPFEKTYIISQSVVAESGEVYFHFEHFNFSGYAPKNKK